MNLTRDDISVSILTFEQLTTRRLYQVLKARAAVFVVEQQCAYQDLDDIDPVSTHVLIDSGDELVAYARVYRGDEARRAHIGRVLTTRRGRHYGLRVMNEAIAVARGTGAAEVLIEAQCYALGFYERVGFEVCSGEFLLDGILHKKMMIRL